ncbi:26S proteasome non-ATPase regulatory subunit 1A [Dorcoceras hygrometricum]|uniref:26S proteasome non-ATPase regulatory subunit 1A n=1 Tax=Dorcoceras hygrometricum TaxID=472368 RepID=A0A2Z7ASI8_9LAMI|nr:26S proteasome non-ATPase regulatory subunit 1A [Dorcoceras hygrometricum]
MPVNLIFSRDIGHFPLLAFNSSFSLDEFQRLFQAAVDRQSGPRPEPRILRQPALEGLKNSTRTESPSCGDRNKSDHEAAARAATGGGAWRSAAARGARRRREVCGEERGGGQVEARV